MAYPQVVNMALPYNPAVLLIGINVTKKNENTCPSQTEYLMLTAVLVIIVKGGYNCNVYPLMNR